MKNLKTLVAVSWLLFLASCSNNTDAWNNNQLPVTPENNSESFWQENAWSWELNPNINRQETPPDFGSWAWMPPWWFGSWERMWPQNWSWSKMMNWNGWTRPPRWEGKRWGYGSWTIKNDSTSKAS